MVSFAVDNMTSGGLNETDVIIRDSHFEVESGDYGDTVKWKPKFETEDGDLKGPMYFNVGKAEFWEVTPDGTELIRSDGTDKGVSKASRFGQFIASLQAAGMPSEVLATGDISALDGVRIHIVQVDLGKSEGGKDKFTYEATKVYEDSISQKVLKKAEKGGKKGKGKAEKKAAAAESEDVDSDLEDKAAQFIVSVLEDLDEDETYTAKELGELAFAAGSPFKGKEKRLVTALVSDPEFLSNGSDWVYDEEEQTVAPL